MKHTIPISLLLLLSASVALPQTSEPGGQAPPSIKSTTEEVLLDIVVRDKHGRNVTDLAAGDLQVIDNGAQCAIKSFRFVKGGEESGQPSSPVRQRTQLDPLRQIRLVTLVFQWLDQDARKRAREAAFHLIDSELPQNVYLAVTVIDHRLQAIQSFTNNRDLVRKAIDRATGNGTSSFESDTLKVRSDLEQILGPNSSGAQSLQDRASNMADGSQASSGPGAAPSGSMMADRLMAQMMLETLRSDQMMETTDGGRATIFALLSLVKEQYRLPGRKTVLYFSPGFSIPQGMEEPFRKVVSVANRANVSIYSLDSRGLNSASSNRRSMEELSSAARSSQSQNNADGGAVRPDQVRALDTAIDSTRANTETTLAKLAEQTGGFLVANTNDFRGPLSKIAEDIETYYEITYVPNIEKYDGSFRKIQVKAERGDLRLQTRNGYFALPPSSAAAIAMNSYEVPLLNELTSAKPARDFSFYSTGMHFRNGAQSIAEVAVDIPLANLALEDDKAAGGRAGRFSYVGLLKNQQGAVVKKFQNDIPLKIPEAKLQAMVTSHFVYTDHFDLPPGRYNLEVAVEDRTAQKSGVRKIAFNLPPAGGALGISTVSMIRSLKDPDPATTAADPLRMEGKVVTPSLAPLVERTGQGLPFYMVIYPNAGNSAPPQLEMEFSREGVVLGSGHPALGKPNAQGLIQYVATAPLAQLQPGSYSVRFIVRQGDETAEESVSFTIQ